MTGNTLYFITTIRHNLCIDFSECLKWRVRNFSWIERTLFICNNFTETIHKTHSLLIQKSNGFCGICIFIFHLKCIIFSVFIGLWNHHHGHCEIFCKTLKICHLDLSSHAEFLRSLFLSSSTSRLFFFCVFIPIFHVSVAEYYAVFVTDFFHWTFQVSFMF